MVRSIEMNQEMIDLFDEIEKAMDNSFKFRVLYGSQFDRKKEKWTKKAMEEITTEKPITQ